MRAFLFYFGLFVSIIAVPVHSEEMDETAQVIFQAMEEEMDRSLVDLKIDVFNPPYFANYQIRHYDHIVVVASLGSLIDSKSTHNRTLFVEVRVGDPKFDSSTPGTHKHRVEQLIPLDNDLHTLKRAIWYETDLRYKQAIMNFLKKKGRFISGVESHNIPDFSKGHPSVVQIEPVPELKVETEKWKSLARKTSALFKQAPEIEKSKFKISADRVTRYYYDSEGNKIRDSLLQYEVILEAWTKTESGSPIHDHATFYFSDPKNFPSQDDLQAKAKKLMNGISLLRTSDVMDPYVGPAIFSPDATAVLFHEAIGHRLEGDRLRRVNDGKTFMKKIGQRILPQFITVVDNPQMKRFKEQDLMGHYRFDDEGQKSERVVLIEEGILKGFLLSRTPVLGFNKTNGHARSDGLKSPMSRMGNVIVRSGKRVSLKNLKKTLLDEIRKQGKPYGLMVKKMMGGETQTESGNFQVFKGKPLYLYKVYADDGREELVRGVEFVGTPLSMISKVLATGDDETVINGFCAAESGFLPVTSVTPSILLSEVELQASPERKLRRPILPPPDF